MCIGSTTAMSAIRGSRSGAYIPQLERSSFVRWLYRPTNLVQKVYLLEFLISTQCARCWNWNSKDVCRVDYILLSLVFTALIQRAMHHSDVFALAHHEREASQAYALQQLRRGPVSTFTVAK